MKKKFSFFIIIIGIIFEIYLYFQLISSKSDIDLKYKLIFLIFCMCSNIALLISYFVIKKKKNLKQENIFLIISITFGMIYLVFIPSMLGTDELSHFLRSYQISTGDIIVKNPDKNETSIPREISEITSLPVWERYTKEKFLSPTDYKDTVKIWNGNVTSIKYSPVPYLPQIIGFLIAKLLRLSPIFTLFFVRFMNFIVWLIFGYFAIKLLPSKKLFATILYTSPAVLSLVATCSGDAFSLGIMFLLFAYILNIIKNKKNVTYKDYIILLILSLLLSNYKMFYVLFVFFIFLIPKKSFKSIIHKLLFTVSIICLSIFADYLWFSLTSINETLQNTELNDQIHFILTHPIYYFMTFINTFFQDLYHYISNLVGGSEMCYSIVKLNQIFVLPYLIILFLSYKSDKNNINFSKFEKIFIFLVCLLIVGLVSTSMYIDWTSHKLGIGSNIIIGVQARYFIPLIIPIIFILPNFKNKFIVNNRFYLVILILDALLCINTINSILIALLQ